MQNRPRDYAPGLLADRRMCVWRTVLCCCGIILTISVSAVMAHNDKVTNSDDLHTKINTVGIRFLDYFLSEAPDRNIIVSPSSIFVATTGLQLAASGQTGAEIANFLGLDQQEAVDNVSHVGQLIRRSSGDEDLGRLYIANALLVHKDLTLNHAYREIMESSLQSTIFVDPEIADLKVWLAEQTAGLIDSYEFSPSAVSAAMTILNATAIKAAWETPFAQDRTAEGEFHGPANKSRMIPMMTRIGEIGLYEDERMRVAKLALRSPSFSVFVILPSDTSSLQKLVQDLTARDIVTIEDKLETRLCRLSIPRFQIDSDLSLRSALIALGIINAMDPQMADFSAATTAKGLYLDDLKHQVHMDVKETGILATAVTTAELFGSIPDPEFSHEFIVNRPFLLLLRNDEDSVVHFMSAINLPH